MSSHATEEVPRITTRKIAARKGKSPIICLTAYTAPMAAILDEVCDVLLVGDSVGMVLHGLPNTVGVTMEMMILHGQAVMRASRRALVVVDMPFGSYETSPEQAHANAVRILKETGAQSVKLESGGHVAETIAFLTRRGVPVMAHVGLRPQAVLAEGGFRAKGRVAGEGECVLAEAVAAAEAGAFAIVVEGVAEDLASRITSRVAIPTIGIGAGSACDGQILVTEDMLGLFDRTARFVRRYGSMREDIAGAVRAYARDVTDGAFPAAVETYFAKV